MAKTKCMFVSISQNRKLVKNPFPKGHKRLKPIGWRFSHLGMAQT